MSLIQFKIIIAKATDDLQLNVRTYVILTMISAFKCLFDFVCKDLNLNLKRSSVNIIRFFF